jgi:hypothetical protein
VWFPAGAVATAAYLASVKEGVSLKSSARGAGISMETGYRVLRDAYIPRRLEGVYFEAAQAELGFRSSRVESWELKIAEVRRDGDRHLISSWCVSVDPHHAFPPGVGGRDVRGRYP